MATRKDVLLVQIVSAFVKGSGGKEMEDDAADWFHTRYYEWIDKPKTNSKAAGRTPQDVWASEGGGFLKCFQEIGKLAAAGGSPIPQKQMEESAMTVERQNECPWCADKP
jgi:hypothetical protein